MNYNRRWNRGMAALSLAALVFCTLFSATGCSSNQNESNTTTESTSDITYQESASDYFTSRDLQSDYDESKATAITLSDESLTITKEGIYVLSGTMKNGQIVIDAPQDAKVQLVLNGVSITNADNACIFAKSADKVFLTLSAGSQNELSTTGEFAENEFNIDAVIFAKCDLTLNGTGSLTIQSDAKHGIVSKDDLKITNGTYRINAATTALTGKDSIRIANGTFDITAGQDGLHSDTDEEDETKGFIYIENGNFTISVDDDGIHAGSLLTVCDGNISITKSYEGLEGHEITIHGGNISIVSSDDGINAARKNTASATDANFEFKKQKEDFNPENFDPANRPDKMENFDPANRPSNFGGGAGGFEADDQCIVTINGGNIYVNAQGDGLDSNGALVINGGTIFVDGPTNSGNGALDYGSKATVNGGIIIAVGASQMSTTFDASSSQASLMATVANASSGDVVILKDSTGKELLNYTSAKGYNNVVISMPELTVGSTYTLLTGTAETAIELTSQSTTIGGVGFGGGSGGRGGFGGDGGFGGPDGMTKPGKGQK